jgi:hypothetical protein
MSIRRPVIKIVFFRKNYNASKNLTLKDCQAGQYYYIMAK